jgi:hypothetical protein
MLVACLLAAALSVAQEPVPDQQQPVAAVLATVHGVVRNTATGEPLPRALVRIEGEADTGALTDGQGRFEIPGVPVGPQTIQVRKPGFFDRPYATEEAANPSDGPAHSVLVAAEMPELAFALTPASAIHGRIELSTGDPAQGIQITLLKQVVRNGRAVWVQSGATKTNGEGGYRFASLSEGIYALFTQPALESEPAVTAVAAGAKLTRQGYPSVFFPEAREFADAARIRLATGLQAEANLQLTLEPFYTVTATAIMPNGKLVGSEGSGAQASHTLAVVLDEAGNAQAYPAQFDAATHTFQAALPDGLYSLLTATLSDEAIAAGQERSPGKTLRMPQVLDGTVTFSVEGHAVTNLRIPLMPVTGWPIHLRAVRTVTQAGANAGKELQNLVTVTVTQAGNSAMNQSGGDFVANEAGTDLLEIPGSHRGSFWLSTQLNDRSLCVDSFNAGGINLAREPLNVGLGASPPPVEMTLRDDCAKLALTLPLMLSAFLPGDEPFYTVYVVPDFDTTADIPPMTIHPSSGAALNVDGLTPGSYHVYTFDHPVRLEYRNPAALAALPTQGQAVTLSAGTTSNLVLELPGQ